MPATEASRSNGSSSGGNVTVPVPSGITGGELLVAVYLADNDGAFASMTAGTTGFVEVSSSVAVATTGGLGKIFTKTARSTEAADFPSGYTWPGSGLSTNMVQILRVYQASTVAAVQWAYAAPASTTSLVSPSVTTPRGGLFCPVYSNEGVTAGATITPPAGISGTSFVDPGNFMQMLVGTRPGQPPGATGTTTGTASTGGNTGVQGYLSGAFVVADEDLFYAGWFLNPIWSTGLPWSPNPGPLGDGKPGGGPAVDAGLAGLGLSAAGAVRKVSSAAATSTLGGSAAPGARKLLPAAGASAIGIEPMAIARKVAPETGQAVVGLAGLAAARKVCSSAGRAVLGGEAQDTVVKRAAAIGLVSVGTTSASAVVRRTVAAGLASLGLSGTAARGAVRAVAGVTSAGLLSISAALKRAGAAGTAPVGLAGNDTARKVSTSAGRATIGVQAQAYAAKRTAASGLVSAGLSSTVSRTAARAVSAAVGLGLAGLAMARKLARTSAGSAIGPSAQVATSRRSAASALVVGALAATAGAARRTTSAARSVLGLVSRGTTQKPGPAGQMVSEITTTGGPNPGWIQPTQSRGEDIRPNGGPQQSSTVSSSGPKGV